MEDNNLTNVQVLEYYGAVMPPEGPGWKPLPCPFHDDSHASAGSNGSGFACHACGVKGSAISLIMQREGIDFASAVTIYEELTGEVHSSLRRKTMAKRYRVNLSEEPRSYERDGSIFSIGSSGRHRPQLGT